MKYIRIGTDRGPVYLNKDSKKVYTFPPFVPNLSYWPNFIMIVCTILLFMAPYIFLRAIIDMKKLVVLLFGITFAMIICIFFSWREQDSYFDYFSQAPFAYKTDSEIKEPFKRQVLKIFRLSLFIVLLFSFIAVDSYCTVNNGVTANYLYYFGIFCSGPMIIISLFALRPIGLLVDYLRYSSGTD